MGYTSTNSRTSIRKMGLCYWKGALLHTVLLSIFAFQKSAAALAFTNPSLAGLTAGAPYNLTWSGASGTTTVTLQNGTANDLETVIVIASDISESFLEWSPYAFTPTGFYVLRLEDTSGQTATSRQFTMMPLERKLRQLPASSSRCPHSRVSMPAHQLTSHGLVPLERQPLNLSFVSTTTVDSESTLVENDVAANIDNFLMNSHVHLKDFEHASQSWQLPVTRNFDNNHTWA